MPELPEVETTCRAIGPLLLGETLLEIQGFVPKLRYDMPVFAGLEGQTVVRLTRRAKYILAALSGGMTLIIHLGMSGRLTTTQPDKHGHFVMATAKHRVYLHDPRRFGLVLLVKTDEVETHPLLRELGPEPLTEAFDGAVLQAALKNIKGPIKPALMLPKVVVGVGNIYASESLFAAGIKPTRPANSLKRKECERLAACIKATLLKSIDAGGSSLRDYAHPNGQLGNFQNDFYVYDRLGEPCRVCGTPVEQMVQAQRSTYFCPHCQQ
jgi:formamidopyrimidine-DNA glycosylase